LKEAEKIEPWYSQVWHTLNTESGQRRTEHLRSAVQDKLAFHANLQ